MARHIPVDTIGLTGDFAVLAEELSWCTPHDAYMALAREQLAAIIEEWSECDPASELSKVFALKLSYVNHDLVRLGCLALDTANIQEAGIRPCYNPARNPLFHYLYTGAGVNDISFARNDWPQDRGLEWSWRVKSIAKMSQAILV